MYSFVFKTMGFIFPFKILNPQENMYISQDMWNFGKQSLVCLMQINPFKMIQEIFAKYLMTVISRHNKLNLEAQV